MSPKSSGELGGGFAIKQKQRDQSPQRHWSLYLQSLDMQIILISLAVEVRESLLVLERLASL